MTKGFKSNRAARRAAFQLRCAGCIARADVVGGRVDCFIPARLVTPDLKAAAALSGWEGNLALSLGQMARGAVEPKQMAPCWPSGRI